MTASPPPFSCATPPASSEDPAALPSSLRVVSWNVHDLFDEVDLSLEVRAKRRDGHTQRGRIGCYLTTKPRQDVARLSGVDRLPDDGIEPRKPRIESFADRPLAASRYRPQSTGSLRTSARLDAQILFTAGICRFA